MKNYRHKQFVSFKLYIILSSMDISPGGANSLSVQFFHAVIYYLSLSTQLIYQITCHGTQCVSMPIAHLTSYLLLTCVLSHHHKKEKGGPQINYFREQDHVHVTSVIVHC